VWDAPAPSVRGSETSEAAAREIEPDTGKLRGAVLGFLRGRGAAGATDEEVQAGLGMGGSTERPRRRELEKAGLVIASGAVRKTGSGRTATVWVAREFLGGARG